MLARNIRHLYYATFIFLYFPYVYTNVKDLQSLYGYISIILTRARVALCCGLGQLQREWNIKYIVRIILILCYVEINLHGQMPTPQSLLRSIFTWCFALIVLKFTRKLILSYNYNYLKSSFKSLHL